MLRSHYAIFWTAVGLCLSASFAAPAKAVEPPAPEGAETESATHSEPEGNTVAEALQLVKTAIEQDYISADFASALQKLNTAAITCERIKCEANVQARILAYQATVKFVGLGERDSGTVALKQALALDPKVALDSDLSNPELVALFGELGGDVNAKAEPFAESPASDPEPAAQSQKQERAREPSGTSMHTNAQGAVVIDVCPPDFPGCDSGEKRAMTCSVDSDCMRGQHCLSGTCGASQPKRNGFSLGLQQDFLLLNSTDQVCSGQAGWTCFEGDSQAGYYGTKPYAGREAGNEIAGGVQTGTVRLLAGYDRFLGNHWALGARLGVAFQGGPKAPGGRSFLPFHGEGRLAYWLDGNSADAVGFHPYVLLGGGIAQLDAKLSVTVFDGTASDTRGERRRVNAWYKSGTAFGEAGFGAMLAFAPGQGPVAELKLLQMFGVSSTNPSLLIGYQIGL